MLTYIYIFCVRIAVAYTLDSRGLGAAPDLLVENGSVIF